MKLILIKNICREYWFEDEIKIFKGCKKILDVGCGTGWFVKFLKENYPETEIVGIDVVDGRKFKDFEFFLANIENLPFEAEIFDGIFCKDVLEHLQNPLHGLIELNRILKKDGKIFISVPDKKDRNLG